MANLVKKCCRCGKINSVEVDDHKLEEYDHGFRSVQDIFAKEHVMVREFIINGMCFNCQSKTFNLPKPDEDWGEPVGNCPECDCQLWKKDLKDGKYHCPTCHQEFVNEELV